jgi:hypothetical protein
VNNQLRWSRQLNHVYQCPINNFLGATMDAIWPVLAGSLKFLPSRSDMKSTMRACFYFRTLGRLDGHETKALSTSCEEWRV